MRKLMAISLFIVTIVVFPQPKSGACLDLDTLTKPPEPVIRDCINISPYDRDKDINCKGFTESIAKITKLTKEDLFNSIKTEILNSDKPNDLMMTFYATSDVREKVNGKSFYHSDIFASILINSYGYTGDIDDLYDVSKDFSYFAIDLFKYYSQKYHHNNVTPELIKAHLECWEKRNKCNDRESIGPYATSPDLEPMSANKELYTAFMKFAKDYDKFIESMVPIYYVRLEKIEYLRQQAEKDKIDNKNKEEALIQLRKTNELAAKWKKLGLSKDILISKIRTYADFGSNAEYGTFVGFIDKLKGIQKCYKSTGKGNTVICEQKTFDEMSGITTYYKYSFLDYRNDGYMLLYRWSKNNKELPPNQLPYFVSMILTISQ